MATFVGNWLGVEDYVMVNDEGDVYKRQALAVAGFALESVHDWVGLVSADGALPSGSDVLEGGRVHPASAYTCTCLLYTSRCV